jgi:hypothetical protein
MPMKTIGNVESLLPDVSGKEVFPSSAGDASDTVEFAPMWGRLEHEIRLLPQVLACSFTRTGDVVVLVDPSADTWATERAVRAILTRSGSTGSVRITGGVGFAPVPIPPSPSISRPVLVGALGATAVLAASSLLGGFALVSDQHGKTLRRGEPALARAPESFDTGLRAIRALVRLPQPAEQASVPGEAIPRSGEPIVHALDTSGASADTAFVRTLALGSLAEPFAGRDRALARRAATERSGVASLSGVEERDAECSDPPGRGAPRARHGRHHGEGPRGWSRSVLVEPHGCD